MMVFRIDLQQNNLKMKKNPVVISFDRAFLIPAGVCLTSLMCNSSEDEFYHFVCLHKGVTQKELDLFYTLERKYKRCSFQFEDMSDKFVDARLSKEAPNSVVVYYRLLIPTLLSDYDKAFFVDVDFIFRSGLGALYYKEDMDDYYLGGVRDTWMSVVNRKHPLALGLNPDEYINGGFLLMNIKKINQDCMVEKWLQEVSNTRMSYLDQDILNLTCQGKIKILRFKYNTFQLNNAKTFYSEEEFEEGRKCGNIHYVEIKPWSKFHRMGWFWWKYYWKLPFGQSKQRCYYLRRLCELIIRRVIDMLIYKLKFI
ncbi:glycosyltransferase family 8 protein [uncultured Parabacteroides sp.]|uniref:glycosyltransferase family 8 protein n=1 Tax=uncultured Parabacteroides sp. TaxID=512312 RepID=UPI0025E50EBA|nr:glycosyltransferase family 8 protein [uncultured Parabacteroides sp.]